MFWMSLLSYLTILDLDSARNPDHSKVVSLGYSTSSAQTCLTVITTLTHSSGWSLIHPAAAYLVRLKLISSGWSLPRPAAVYLPRLKHISPDKRYVTHFSRTRSRWSLYCGRRMRRQPREYKQLRSCTTRDSLLHGVVTTAMWTYAC